MFKINQSIDQILLLLLDNESKRRKAQEHCTENMNICCSKALNESHVYTQNQLEKVHFKYEILNLNDIFQQMNEPYSQNLVPPARLVSSKSSRSSKSNSSSISSNANRKG